MKSTKHRIILVLAVISCCIGLGLTYSYRKIRIMEAEVISHKPTPAEATRTMRLGMLDPSFSLLPYWQIYYAESPTNIHSDSVSLSVNIFGRVVDGSSKEVGIELESRGYISK